MAQFTLRAGRSSLALILLWLTGAAAHAAPALGPLFGDGAVLQCDKPVAVWGTATPGETVQVTFAGQTCFAATGRDGRWMAMLDAMPANPAGGDLVVTAKDGKVAAHDVVVGEVWLCAGESNMEARVNETTEAAREIAAADFPLLRDVRIEPQIAAAPTRAVATSGWKPAMPANVGDFTAVGYFFGREIQSRLGVPVGLIHSSWADTPIEAWMSPQALAAEPAFRVATQRWQETIAGYDAAKSAYATQLAAWTAAQAAAKARGEKALAKWTQQNPRPSPPHGGPGDPGAPSGLYNGMINPLAPYALRGVLWYQGESNTDEASAYPALFAAMITDWRTHFAQGDIPFFWVNLPAGRGIDPMGTTWAVLREAQTKTLSLPNTGQAIAIDLGDPVDIHPHNEQEAGRRLALLAKHRVYGVMTDDTGPVFAGAAPEGNALRVRFTNGSGALVSHTKPPQALEVAGADHVFHPALGRIEHETLRVWSPQVKQPIAVRYAWRNCPEANLYGGNGLPVPPFRSDEW